MPLSDVLAAEGDDLDETERRALHAELDASIEEADAGKLVDAEQVLSELRSMR